MADCATSDLPSRASLACLWLDRPIRRMLAAALAVHLLLALGFHLSPDEAHYALYASHLDWSYFDHPPLVGWLQWPAVALGAADGLLRVVPLACWLLAAWGLVRLSEALYPAGLPPAGSEGRSAGGLSDASHAVLLLWLLSPLPHLLGLALVPDSLLMALTCPILLLVWRLCEPGQQARLPTWLGLGLCLGLAGLAKYTALLLGLSAVAALAWAHGWRLLARRGFWLATALALTLVLPVLAWNVRHDWISFAYQLGHAAGASAWRPSRVLGFYALQMLGYGLLLLAGLWAAWRRPDSGSGPDTLAGPQRRRLPPLAFAACFGVPPLLLYGYLAGRGSSLPHWAVSAWVALLPVAAQGCHGLWSSGRRAGLRAMAGWQLGCCGVMVGLLLGAGLGSETGEQARSRPGELGDQASRNPLADLYGWDNAAVPARALADAHGVNTLAVMNWSLASRLAWYARPMAVKVVNPHQDQFSLWFGNLAPGDSVLLVDWSIMSFAPPVGPSQFRECRWLEQQPVRHLGRQLAHFNFLLCRHWQGPGLPMPGRGLPSLASPRD